MFHFPFTSSDMIQLKQILKESLTLYEMEVLIRTSRDKDINKIEIYNRLRALQGVVVVNVEQNNFLHTKTDERSEYSLIHIKYIVGRDPIESMNIIKQDALMHSKIPGLLQFIPRIKTVKKKGSY